MKIRVKILEDGRLSTTVSWPVGDGQTHKSRLLDMETKDAMNTVASIQDERIARRKAIRAELRGLQKLTGAQ